MHRADAFTPFNLTLARAQAQHVPIARDRQNRHNIKARLPVYIFNNVLLYTNLSLHSN
jgi:hypothetical protein